MPVWICATCANHYPDQESAPPECVICPSVAIGQRGLVIRTPQGNLLRDPPGFIDEQAVGRVKDAGGLPAVTASHLHFYGSIVEWIPAFGASILLPEADAHWLTRPDPAVRTWSGSLEVLPGVTLVQRGCLAIAGIWVFAGLVMAGVTSHFPPGAAAGEDADRPSLLIGRDAEIARLRGLVEPVPANADGVVGAAKDSRPDTWPPAAVSRPMPSPGSRSTTTRASSR
jgi:hypothetical protein